MPDVTIPTTEPKQVFAGDTWAWSKSVPDYPASAGWSLKYALVSAAGKLAITASASGDDYSVSVPAADTANVTAGTYTWRSYVEQGTDRHTIEQGSIVVADGFDGTSEVDARSDAQKALDAARAAFKTYTETNGAVSEYEINGRRVKYHSPQQLRELVNYWAGEVQREENAAKRRSGKPLAGRILTRFGR